MLEHELADERTNRGLDNDFAANVLDHTKKRMGLQTWIKQEQAQLNAYSRTVLGFSVLSALVNYTSPFWTGFIVNDPDKSDWKTKWDGVLYWGTMRNFFTQFPLYLAGKTYLDYRQYKLNSKEIENRITLCKDFGFRSQELIEFKKSYDKKVLKNQVIVPLCFMGLLAMTPVTAEAIKTIQDRTEPVNIKTMVGWSIGASLIGGYIYQRWGSKENQEWFENNKPKFCNLLQTNYIFNGGTIISRKHQFGADVPL